MVEESFEINKAVGKLQRSEGYISKGGEEQNNTNKHKIEPHICIRDMSTKITSLNGFTLNR